MADYTSVNTNTNSVAFFDDEGNMMRCGLLNDSISISFVFPTVGADGKKIYKNAPSEHIVLSKDRVSALYDIIIRKVLGAVESKTEYNGGVFTSNAKNSIFEIAVRKGDIIALLHKEIDGERTPKKSVMFKFSKTPIIERYVPSGSDFDIPLIDANFALFVKLLEGFMLVAANGTSGHSGRYTNRMTTDRVLSKINEIGIKLGVAPDPVYTSDKSDSGSGFNTTPSSYQEADSLSSLLTN